MLLDFSNTICNMRFPFKKKIFIWALLASLLIIGLALGLYFSYKEDKPQQPQGAVISNGVECAKIGSDVLLKGGSAIDAAIATLFCEGISCPQSMGIGGGFLATIYTKSTGRVEALIARETAPNAASRDMFKNVTIQGGIAVAVPGEIKGYWALHKKHGKLEWSSLIEPTIKLCENGHIVSRYLATILKKQENRILEEESLKEIFINPKTGKVWNQGNLMKRPKLAETLRDIAVNGEHTIYGGGNIGQLLAKDIHDFGGIITEQDFLEYQVQWRKPQHIRFMDEFTVYSSPLPGSGSVLGFILNLAQTLITQKGPLQWHRIVESFKHAYGLRTWLGDIDFVPEIKELVENMTNPEFSDKIRELIKDDITFDNYTYYGANFSNSEDYGTANIAVIAPNGDAITVTSTINNILGAKIRSRSTGIILNDEMDDFSVPGKANGFGIEPSPANFIEPKKRPLSSMCPTIIIDDKGDVKLLIGAAGGSKITSSVALAIIRHLITKEGIGTSIQAKRLHHQLAPKYIEYETGFDRNIIDTLQKLGHEVKETPPADGFAAITAIGITDKEITPVCDERRNGSSSVIEIVI